MKAPIKPGIAAISLKGRDKGRPFVVLCELDADFVLLADGGLRGLSRPKKKRRKHLRTVGHEMAGLQEAYESKTLTDHHIRMFLKDLQNQAPTEPAARRPMFVKK